MVADLLSSNRCHWWIAKVKNYNLNVTEILDPTLKKKFSRNFQFHRRDPSKTGALRISISKKVNKNFQNSGTKHLVDSAVNAQVPYFPFTNFYNSQEENKVQIV